MSTAAFYRRVLDETGGTDRALAERGTAAVLRSLRDRLTPEEARQVASQLPRALRETWDAGAEWGVRPVKLHRRELYEEIKRAFAGHETVQVILDRRVSQRREKKNSPMLDRRRNERRSRSAMDEQLRTIGWSLVLLDLARAKRN